MMNTRGCFPIGAAIGCGRITGDDPGRLAKGSRDVGLTRRVLALATIYDEGSRSQAARLGGLTLQVIRDSVVRFNAEGPAGLSNRKAPGRRRFWAGQRAALARTVAAGPKPDLDGVVHWRLVDLVAGCTRRSGYQQPPDPRPRVSAMGSGQLSARPQATGRTRRPCSRPAPRRRASRTCGPHPASQSGPVRSRQPDARTSR